MKYIFKSITFVALLIASFVGCSDWVEVESNDYYEPFGPNYYEDLKAYKASDHAVTFGWFGNWTGEGASMAGSLMGLPDSVDFVSMWGNTFKLTDARKKDKQLVKELKGTRVLMCWIISDIGDQLTPLEATQGGEESIKAFWGWDDNDPAKIDLAIERYANAIIDSMNKYDYDGFDIDYEPNHGYRGSLCGNEDRMLTFVKALGKHIGPKSGTSRLLVVDGEPDEMPAESAEYFDYFIVQAYWSSGDRDLDTRLQLSINKFDGYLTPERVAEMHIFTENFESLSSTGGVRYTDRNGNVMQSLEGMARWKPVVNGVTLPRSGGMGSFHMEYDYPGPREYKYLRDAIQAMNPAVH